MGDQRPEETVGSYRLTECRSEGHMARVCKGLDRTTMQKVLVRIVDPLACRNERIRAVLEDLRDPHSARRVHDPHILKLLDVGMRGDSYYTVHEDFDGVPLDEYVKEARPPLREMVSLARAVAECLRAVHGYKLVHGDLKPRNVLVARDEHGKPVVKLAMADLAHDASDAMISVYGELVGTPKYLSPEQIQGRSATGQSDLFSLGVMLYEMFSGREPFPADSPIGYLHANVAAPLNPLAAVDTAIPQELSLVVSRLLARQPRDRYRTAQAVVEDLERVEGTLSGIQPEPLPAGADSAFAPKAPGATMPHGGTGRIVALTATATALVLLIGGLAVYQVHQTIVRQREKAASATAQATQEEIIPAPNPTVPTPVAPVEAATAPTQQPPVPPERIFEQLLPRIKALADSGRLDDLRDLRDRFRDDPLVLRIEPEIAKTLYARAKMLEETSRMTEALDAYRAIVRDYPAAQEALLSGRRIPNVMLALAAQMKNSGAFEDAVTMLEAIVSEFPGSMAATEDAPKMLPPLRLKLVEMFMGNHQPDRAIAVLEKILASKPSDVDAAKARIALASALIARAEDRLAKGDEKEALADLREAEPLVPALRAKVTAMMLEPIVHMALAAWNRLDATEALKLWKELQERAPDNHFIQENEEKMAPLLEAAKAAGSDDAPAILWALADKEMGANGFDAARPYVEKIMASYPKSPQARKASEVVARHEYTAALTKGLNGDVAGEQAALEKLAAAYPGTDAAKDAPRQLAMIKACPPEMVFVPAGECPMGLSAEQVAQVVKQLHVPSVTAHDWFQAQQPALRINPPAYYIDRHPVTNEEYKAFVDATKREPPPSPDWNGKEIKGGRQKQPVTNVSLADAQAYATWAKKRLPSEAEWEKAARGPDGRFFPWGPEFDPNRCVTAASTPPATGTQPVEIIPDGKSPYGAFDMAGNVQQWTASPFLPYEGAEDAAPPIKGQQSVRGANWQETFPFQFMVTRRIGVSPAERLPTLGFRCAKSVGE